MLSIETAIHSLYPGFRDKPAVISRPLIALLRRVLHEHELNTFFKQHPEEGMPFIEAVLSHLDVSYSVDQNEIENIPAMGKLIIASNHPMGALDAFSLIHLVSRTRQNGRVKIVANQVLMQVPQLKEMLIPVDNMTGKLSKKSMRLIEEALEQEAVVIFFPAGEVARFRPWGVSDYRWKKGFLTFARKTSTAILPIYIHARNSALFYITSAIYKPLGTLLLPHEIFKARHARLRMKIGELIHSRVIQSPNLSLNNHAKMFRKHLYRISREKSPIYHTECCIAHPEKRQLLREELKQAEQIGESPDGKKIYLATYKSAPSLMREIGRLREYTFRMVDEGTGKKRDLDRYDRHYKHIVLWDDDALEVVGAYRIAESAEIVQTVGKSGLYMHELCHLHSRFQKEYLPQAIELGRSFVQPRYWGSNALDYLWHGIGSYLRQHPEVRYMYGPVSISHTYPQAAKNALVYFYTHYFRKTSKLLQGKEPFRISEAEREALSALFTGNDFDNDFKILRSYLKALNVSVPTLYKQYSDLCEQGGFQIADFGIDREFGNCIDGYVIADVSKIKEKKRLRYIKPHSD